MVAEDQPARMQMVWKHNKKRTRPLPGKSFQFQSADNGDESNDMDCSASVDARPGADVEAEQPSAVSHSELPNLKESREQFENSLLSKKLLNEGNSLAEEGRFGEALGKWEAALYLTPRNAVLHEQKAQVLLEIGKSWSAVQSAKSATELQPRWVEAWVTLARAQLNYGEPSLAVDSAQTALMLEPGHKEANTELERAQFLAIRQRQVVRESVALNLAAEGSLLDGQNGVPSCRRARVYDPKDIFFTGEQHMTSLREPEPEKKDDDKFDKYNDDTYDWVDELKRPAREITTDDLMSDFTDTI